MMCLRCCNNVKNNKYCSNREQRFNNIVSVQDTRKCWLILSFRAGLALAKLKGHPTVTSPQILVLSEFRLLTHTAYSASASPEQTHWSQQLPSLSSAQPLLHQLQNGLLSSVPNIPWHFSQRLKNFLSTCWRRRNHQFHQWTLWVARQQSTTTHSSTSRQGSSGSHGTETSSDWIMLKNEKVRRRGREYYWLGKPRPLKQAFLYLLVKIRLSCWECMHPWGCLSSHPAAVQCESLPCWFTQ